jgi:hypothetical protein
MFVPKTCAFNVDEIDTWSQFHQRYMYKSVVQTSFFYVHVTRKSCRNATLVQKTCAFNVDEIDTWSGIQGRV